MSEVNNMNTSDCIKVLRKKRGLTQKQLAEKSGLSIASIQGYEQGKYNPKIETLSKIAYALNMPVESLFGDINTEKMTEFDIAKLKHLTMPTALGFNEKLENWISGFEETKSDKINDLFESLNEQGQDKAIEQVELLTKIPEYRKDNDE